MRTLYFDCFAGASGNMILGALIALGMDPDALRDKLAALGVEGFEVRSESVNRSGIQAIHVDVAAAPERTHRHLKDIASILDSSGLSESVRDRATRIFTRLAEAEAAVHGCRVEQVHFHEVGAIDAIVDVVGACIGFEMLGIERFVGSRMNVGSGFVQIEHGTYPVPPPAVADLLKGVPAYSNGIEGELLTPTGAAIITTLCDEYRAFPEITVEKVGYGAGTRTYDKFPNVLRLILGEGSQVGKKPGDLGGENGIEVDQLVVLEANIDDTTPQVIAYASERLMSAGALDCWVTAIQMKKGRPAHLFSVICRKGEESGLAEIIFQETTSLGVRCSEAKRFALEREFAPVQTRFGQINLKIGRLRGKIVNVMPEFDEVASAAEKFGVAVREVQAEALAAYSAGRSTAAHA